jgi:hypothetical protein
MSSYEETDWFNYIENNPDKPWNWEYLSENPNITWDIVVDNPEKKWDYDSLSVNPNITWDIIEANLDKPWIYELLSENLMYKYPFFNNQQLSYLLK